MIAFDVDGAGPARPELAVCGSFNYAGTTFVDNAVMWDGSRWMPMGEGGEPSSAAASIGPGVAGAGPRLIVGGDFAAANNIKSWDGARGRRWAGA